MKIEISRTALDAIRTHAAATPDVEVCGLLFGSAGRIEAAQAADNAAMDPARRFEVDPAALFRAIRAERAGGPGLAGYYHSHPNGLAIPSEEDRKSAAIDGKIWIIAAGDEITAWRFDGAAFQPLRIACF